MNIDNEYIEEVHKLVNELCPNVRKPKYDFYYYIENIILMLTDLIKWSSLKKIHKNKKPYHYKSIYKTFIKWSKLEIFKIAYDNIIIRYVLDDINSSNVLNLFLDTMHSINKHGSELATFGQIKKHKTTKTSICCDKNNIIYGALCYKGSEHDVNTVEDMTDEIASKTNFRKINFICDKAYIMKKINKEKLLKKNVHMITPYRKNQKNKKTGKKLKNTKKEKNKLKYRYKIEHVNCTVKKYDRLNLRKDVLIHTFKSFLFLAIGCNLFL
jgi:hypothetical protein